MGAKQSKSKHRAKALSMSSFLTPISQSYALASLQTSPQNRRKQLLDSFNLMKSAVTSSNEKISCTIKHDQSTNTFSVTLRSPINIALVKYWGKAHEQLIIPTNNSLSLTINKAQLCSTTTVTLSDSDVDQINLQLNGKVQSQISDRILRVINQIKKRASETLSQNANQTIAVKSDSDVSNVPLQTLLGKKCITITSVNNFATAAGLASSASGLACLARCMSAIYGLEEIF